MQALTEERPEGLVLRLTTPPGGDPTGYEVITAVGEPPTIGALAYYIPQAGTAWLFTQQRPWTAQTLTVGSSDELIELANSAHGQTVRCNLPTQ